MNKPVFRRTIPADAKDLRRIWLEAYPGDEPYADIFFDMNMHLGSGYTAESGRRLCSMIFCLKDYVFNIEEKKYPAAYLYALGTLTAARGEGAGSKLTAFAAADACKNGSGLVCLMPASSSLRNWYIQDLHASEMFCHRSFRVEAGDTPQGLVTRISPGDYLAMREKLLEHTPHTEIPEPVIRLQEAYSQLDGGGLYQINIDGRSGICSADCSGDELMIRELLLPGGDPEAGARVLMQTLSCRCANVRTPAFWHDGLGSIENDCLRLPASQVSCACQTKPYWGFFLD